MSRRPRLATLILVAVMIVLAVPFTAFAKKKKVQPAPAPVKNWMEQLDLSKFVWPAPPGITRIRYLNYFCCEKYEPPKEAKKKTSWMERLAGGETQAQKQAAHPMFALWTPYGMAVDSKGQLYVADGKVGAVFIFNTETKDLHMIKNGRDARFGLIMGLAMDDDDRLFVSDAVLHHVLVFDKDHKLQATISEAMVDPCGLALDTENRFLYVVDTGLDQVLVFDADSLRLLRRIGVTGKNHTLTGPGEFSKPTNAAVDQDGNLFVTDTLNNRIEEFDPDGEFIRAFGKAGDGIGYFARPKGIAIDADGDVWVVDAVNDRVQVYTPEGRLLMWMGGHGEMPGQFQTLAGIAIDKQNRVFTSEQYPARVQMFRYFTNAEARTELDRREAADKKQEPQSSEQAKKQVPNTTWQ